MAQRMQQLEEEVARLRASQAGKGSGAERGRGGGEAPRREGDATGPAPPADAPIQAHVVAAPSRGAGADDLVALFSQDGAAGVFADESSDEEREGREPKRKKGGQRSSGPVSAALMGVVKVRYRCLACTSGTLV